MLKLTTDKHEALRGLSETAELLVLLVLLFRLQIYHCVQLNYFLFSSPTYRGHAAGRDKQTFAGASPTVRSRPTLHGPRQLFLSRCSSHVQQLMIDSQWCMADCVIYTASSSVNVFDNSHVQQSSIASYYTRIAICAYTPPAFDAPVRGVPVGVLPSRLARKKTRMVWLREGVKN